MAKQLRIGVIGTGFSAHFHLASYRKVYGQDFVVAGIFGRNRQRTAELAAEFSVPGQYDSVEAMLHDPTIDAVDLCVPNHLHVPLILQAAAAGKHIICEKPLGGFFGPAEGADTWTANGFSRAAMLEAVLGELRLVDEAVRRAGVTFCYAENWVYAPPIVKLNRLMAASESTILRIQGEESHSGSHSPYSRHWRTSGGGSLVRLGVHPIGAALFLKYEEGRRRNGVPIRPASVLAQTANLTAIDSFRGEPVKHIGTGWEDVEDWASLLITFEDGSIAQLTSSDTHLGGIRNYITAHGSRALVTANINPNNACQAYTPDGAYFASEYLVEKTETKEGWSFPAPDEDAITGYPEELRDFVDAIANDRKPRSDLMLARDVLVTVYAGYLSADEGRAVPLDGMI